MPLPRVGVEAVVEGISKFVSDFNKISASTDRAALGFGKLGQAVSGITSYFIGFGRELLGLGQIILGVASGNVPMLISGIINLVVGFTQGIKGAVQFAAALTNVLISAILKVINVALSPFIAAWRTLIDIVKVAIGVFAGLSLSNLITNLGEGLKNLVSSAFEAASAFQLLEIRLQGLLALQISQGTTVNEVTTRSIELTAAQQLRMMELNRTYKSQNNELTELSRAYGNVSSELGANSIAALQLEARMDALREAIGGTSAELQNIEGLKTVTTVNELITGTMSFSDAMEAAVPRAQALFTWLSKIGILTPFTVQDIASVFTLATSYGFAETQAKELTQATIDFTAGMGLSGETMERIIQNLGQMVQQGKITGTELRDLGRGAFVPVNEILKRTAEIMGITTAQLSALRKAGRAPVGPFIQAFIEFSTESFPNAAERMARTLPGVISNIKDLVQVVVGMRIIKPALDVVVQPLADFIQLLLSMKTGGTLIGGIMMGGRGINEIADQIGASFARMAQSILGTLPSVEEVVGKLLASFEKLATFIDLLSRGYIEAAITSLGLPDWITQSVTNLYNSFVNIKTFWEENGETIKTAIFDALGSIWEAIFGEGGKNPFETLSGSFLEFTENLDVTKVVDAINEIKFAILEVVAWLSGNKKGDNLPLAISNIKTLLEGWITTIDSIITKFTEIYNNAILVRDVVREIMSLGLAETTIEGGFLGAIGNLFGLGGGTEAGGKGMGKGVAEIGKTLADSIFESFSTETSSGSGSGALGAIDTWIEETSGKFEALSMDLVGHSIIPEMWAAINTEFVSSSGTVLGTTLNFLTTLRQAFNTAAASIVSTFSSAGTRAIDGFIVGFVKNWAKRKPEFETVIEEIMDLVRELMGIDSPSKVFAKFGAQMMAGMAKGVERGVPLVQAAMESVMTALPGSASSPFTGGATTNNTVNYNVSMNSNNNFPTATAPQDDLAATLALLRSF